MKDLSKIDDLTQRIVIISNHEKGKKHNLDNKWGKEKKKG